MIAANLVILVALTVMGLMAAAMLVMLHHLSEPNLRWLVNQRVSVMIPGITGTMGAAWEGKIVRVEEGTGMVHVLGPSGRTVVWPLVYIRLHSPTATREAQ